MKKLVSLVLALIMATALLTVGAKLQALSPLAVLTRGYSAVFNEEGNTVHKKEQLKAGDQVTIRLSDGCAKAEIREVE